MSRAPLSGITSVRGDDACSVGLILTRPGSAVSALLEHAQWCDTLGDAARTWAAAHHCTAPQAVTCHAGLLIVHVSDAASGTALRYRANELLRFLQLHYALPVTRVTVRIQPHAEPSGVQRGPV
ncbi:MAG: hypothetical protein EPN72_06825 [Nevskiaceae bacterium]|nr:MAG: hypothetical protein EPN63_10525 [Nevskiaceae bacterium]TBR73392.1 MAG: hypothetical protein EPN72_06825 [Nevskiaceae bacterium]